MHDGYAGDHKDYYKFLILRSIAQRARFRICVCWMRTPPGGGGNDDTKYLGDRSKWVRSPECVEVFDAFENCVNGSPQRRSVAEIERLNLIPNATYFSEMVTRQSRPAYWEAFDHHLEHSEVDCIFFDPNTGVQSCPTRDHLGIEELATYYAKQKSLLIIQFHTDRSKKIEDFIRDKALEIIVALDMEHKRFAPELLWCFWGKTLLGNANVFFYLMAQQGVKNRITPVIAHLKGLWKGCQIKRSTGKSAPCFTVKSGPEILKRKWTPGV